MSRMKKLWSSLQKRGQKLFNLGHLKEGEMIPGGDRVIRIWKENLKGQGYFLVPGTLFMMDQKLPPHKRRFVYRDRETGRHLYYVCKKRLSPKFLIRGKK